MQINITSLAVDLSSKPDLLLDFQINNFKYIYSDFEDNKKFRRLKFKDRFFYLPTVADFNGKINIKACYKEINQKLN